MRRCGDVANGIRALPAFYEFYGKVHRQKGDEMPRAA